MGVTTVVNVRREEPDVYVGRGSQWGNPFSHVLGFGQVTVSSRAEAVRRYEEWLLGQPTLVKQLWTLRGKRLGCYCFPEACHADVLARLADRPLPPCTCGRRGDCRCRCDRCGSRNLKWEAWGSYLDKDLVCQDCRHEQSMWNC